MTKTAPYPASTRAKGWRFELDYEVIEQSDTWALAATKAFEGLPLARPLLLATWYAAWRQTPCGSLPANDSLAAAAIGIPLATFLEYRDVLMRGWWLADDGRLYHDTLVARVVEMMGRRRSDADRQATRRARIQEPEVTQKSRVTHTGVHRESSTDHRPPTVGDVSPTTPRRLSAKGKAKNLTSADLIAVGVPQQAADDWLTVRRAKRAPLTQTAWDGIVAEAAKAKLSPAEAVKFSASMSWQGFKASWYAAEIAKGNGHATHRPTKADKHAAFMADLTGRKPNGPDEIVVDVAARVVE